VNFCYFFIELCMQFLFVFRGIKLSYVGLPSASPDDVGDMVSTSSHPILYFVQHRVDFYWQNWHANGRQIPAFSQFRLIFSSGMAVAQTAI